MPYTPDQASLSILGGIMASLAQAQAVSGVFKRAPKFIARLPGGELYFDSSLELDTDGWPGPASGDPTHQSGTSLTYHNGVPIDANRVPYFVLPLPVSWPRQFGINLGDYAAIIYKARLAFGVFADFGNNPGEGSLELLRRLGAERLNPDGTVINRGMGPGVITLVFPGSGPGVRMADEATLKAAIDKIAPERFKAAGGVIDGANPASALLAVKMVEINPGLGDRMIAAAQKELTDYGRFTETQSPLKERIGVYFQQVGEQHDGADGTPWSAAFISYMVHLAGGDAALRASAQHSIYVHQAILDRAALRQGRFWAYRTSEVAIAPGDILAMNRGNARPIDYDEAVHSDDYASHADICVAISGKQFSTVGGNVGKSPGTVGTKTFRWNGGILQNAANPKQQIYAILRPPAI